MAEEFDIVRAQNLPAASSVNDSDMLLVVQGGMLKRVPPTLMKGKMGDPGPGSFLGVSETHILWKQGANGSWNNLFEIEKLRGPKGEKPEFRKVNGCLMMKYEGQPDSALVNIFDREELKMKFSDLIPAEVNQLKLHFSDLTDADKAELMKPATDAAARADKVLVDTNAAKDAALDAAGKANTEASNLEELKKAVTTASYLAEEKAGEAEKQAAEAKLQAANAEEQANYARQQGDYAKLQAGKLGQYEGRITALETGKVDGGYSEEGLLQLTSQGLPVGDPIEVGSGTGGGGGGGITCKLKTITDTLLSTVSGPAIRIGYNFTSVYADDGSETGNGTAIYTINSQKVATEAILQGDVYFDVTKWLIVGTNTVKVTIKDSTGQSRSVVYTVEVISMSIADSYDDAQVNSSEITYRYTPVGAINKKIHFILDGTEVATKETTDSNRQLSQVVPAQTHGAHRLQVFMTASVSGVEVRSNTLTHDLICTEAGNNAIIIASAFNQATAKQYDKLAIPFIVYNPALSTSPVTLSVNDVILSEQTVDRTLQTWNYRLNQAGNITLKITSGEVSKSFTLTVSEAETIVEAETADLELYLTSQNRSNNDNNKSEWKYNEIAASLVGFNYRTDGWITTDGSTALRVSGDALVTIPFNIFASDFRSTGKTIEFEFATHDVVDYDATVISCLSGNIGLKVTAQQALFKSEQTTVDTRFKEDERVRVTFVVEKRTDYRLVYIYINGIMSGVAQYPADDNFQQAAPVGIMIGSNDCTVDIYNIRIYHNNLTQYQVLDNYMADMDDYDRKMEVYGRNQVFDEYGNISYQKVVEQIPCMILEGPLPTFKGDKKTNKVYFTSLQEPARDFSCENIQNDVQGTSSQYYPRKNFKFKFKTTITYTESGEANANYALRSESIPVNCFCIKADFAESSGTHNTGLAKVIEGLLKSMNILTPPQKTNVQVRTTVDGYPICLFHRETPDAELAFVGKYNFNNDKSTETTFGFSDGDESWEFLNNTSDRSLFKSADFSTDDWQNDFEARYPDGSLDKTNLQSVMEWVVSTISNTAKFKAEAADHFDLRNLLSYYLITELFGMVDQRAKNMFLTRYAADGKWRFIFYDNDTCNGINNEGLIAFGYGIEYHDREGTLNVFNGEQSVLWNNVEVAFASELAEMYREMRTHLSYASVTSVLNGEQSNKWCEAIYNADGRYKYINPFIEDGNGSYLYAAQGSREEHRKWWLFSRFLYMDSKYNAADFLTDYATMRLYTPQVWAGVEPNADFTITPFADQYVRVKYGSYILAERCKKDVPVTIPAPAIQFNDTETIVYGASRIKSLGDLSGKYAGTIDMSKATRLAELHIGSEVEGYHNDNLTVLSVGSNRMLRKLNVRNCFNLRQPVDVSGCENIEELYAAGTIITTAVFAPAGILKKLELPSTITNLSLKNQPKLLDTFFELAGVEKLSTIISENTPGVNIFPIVDNCLSLTSPALSRVRLININSTGSNLDSLYKLTKVGGIDEKGNNVPLAIVTGKYHAITAVEDKLTKIRAAFPELTVTYTNLMPPTITTLTFSSSQNKSIVNAVFDCRQEYTKENEYTYKVSADDETVLNISFKCDNHNDFIAEYIVAGTRTQNYSLVYIPLRTIRVKVYNQSVYPSGARVVVGDKVYLSDANGYIYIRGGEAIEGSVSAAGYGGGTFNYPAITNDTNDTLEVYAVVDVRFIVKNKYNDFIQGAFVTCDGKSGTTNLYGECILQLSKGTYEYSIVHSLYFEYKGNIDIGTSAITKDCVMKLNFDPFKPEENGNIQLLMKGVSVTLIVESTDTNYVIGWGDGTEDSATEVGRKTYAHTYSDSSMYQIEISNCQNITYAVKAIGCLLAYWSIGNSKVSNLTFRSLNDILYIGDLWKNDQTRTSFSYLAYNCYSLQKIDFSSLQYNMVANDLSYLLYGCNSLVSVDITPLAGMKEVLDLNFFLYDCQSLSSIDLNPLSQMTKNKSLNGFLYYCIRLTSVDLTPLTGMTEVTSLNGFLYGCRGLTSVDLTPLVGMKGNTDLAGFLASCVRLTSVDLTPLTGMTEVTSLNGFLSGCRGLTSVDLTPLGGMTKVTYLGSYIGGSSDGFLSSCIGLNSVDLTPLAGMTKLTTTSYLLYGSSNLSFIILGWETPPPASSTTLLTTGDGSIYTPSDSVELYKTATNWNRYTSRYKPSSEFSL